MVDDAAATSRSNDGHPDLPLIHQDGVCVAVDKPPGMLVHPSFVDVYATHTVVGVLEAQLSRKVYPVHRLDRPTSGVLLLGLDSSTARLLSVEFECQRVQKEYLAIVRGWTADFCTIDDPLIEIRDRIATPWLKETRPPQPAVTTCETLDRCEVPWSTGRYPSSRYSLVRLRPKTGRRHQIRRHLNRIAHPIVGDVQHGDHRHNHMFRDQHGIGRMLLVSERLVIHPAGFSEPLNLTATVGHEFQKALSLLNLDPQRQTPDVQRV